MERAGHEKHLTDGELFTLAIPPAGDPEALPRHLSECLACSRALSEWKTAARDLAGEDADAVSRRSPQEWEALEQKTLAAIRRSRIGKRRLSWRWIAMAAASLLLFALALPLARSSRPATRHAQNVEFTPEDREDDALLRDVARLTRGDEGNGTWNTLVPEPDGVAQTKEERL